MALQRQQQTSANLKGQLLQWSADKRAEEEYQAMVEQAVLKLEKRRTLAGLSIAAVILGVVALICGIVGINTGDVRGTALWMGAITIAIADFIVGYQVGVPLAKINEREAAKTPWYMEGNPYNPHPKKIEYMELWCAFILSLLALILVAAGKNEVLIAFSCGTVVVEFIVYLVARNSITKLNNIIQETDDY
jgi:hypothetical protein